MEGFIADQSISMLLRALVHAPFTEIALRGLQRLLPLEALGMKPRLRYRSDTQVWKPDRETLLESSATTQTEICYCVV